LRHAAGSYGGTGFSLLIAKMTSDGWGSGLVEIQPPQPPSLRSTSSGATHPIYNAVPCALTLGMSLACCVWSPHRWRFRWQALLARCPGAACFVTGAESQL